MHRTFNMGCGMIVAVSADVADDVCKWLENKLPGCQVIGSVVDNGRKVTHTNSEILFEHY